jgi:excinuclease ABC subunit A
LEQVIDRCHELGEFSSTDWNARNVVEIAASRKADGWFLHALTGEAWLITLKFRVASSAFQQRELNQRLGLPTLNQMDEIPLYGNQPRVRVRSTRGPLQEVELQVHSLDEINHDAFWNFLAQAVDSFQRVVAKSNGDLESHMPWKKLGRKWHMLKKGFPPGNSVQWDVKVLEELCSLLEQAAPGCQFQWTNQQLVTVQIAGRSGPWATLHTKRPEAVRLSLFAAKNSIAFGRVASIGIAPELDGSRETHDVVRFHFRTLQHVRHPELPDILAEHYSTCAPPDPKSAGTR